MSAVSFVFIAEGKPCTLAFDPRPEGVVKMAGDENLWRIRVGRYRVVYEIHDREVEILVLRIGHRKDVHRGKKGRR